MITKTLDWFASPTGRKINFYLDMTHAINALVLVPSTGLFKFLWGVNYIMAGILFLTGVYSLVCAQKYYSDNYRN